MSLIIKKWVFAVIARYIIYLPIDVVINGMASLETTESPKEVKILKIKLTVMYFPEILLGIGPEGPVRSG